MSAHVIDSALFRLRAFETDWLAPLTAMADSVLSQLLIAEAERWIVLGQRLGYFADVPREASVPPERLSRFDRYFTDGGAPSSDFWSRLSDAQDDLTPARCEYLRLALFATDAEFDIALLALSHVEAAVADPATLALLVDNVEWALQGAESQIGGSWEDPAHWRSSDRTLAQVGGPRAAQRLSELGRWRRRMAGAAGLQAAVAVTEARDRQELLAGHVSYMEAQRAVLDEQVAALYAEADALQADIEAGLWDEEEGDER